MGRTVRVQEDTIDGIVCEDGDLYPIEFVMDYISYGDWRIVALNGDMVHVSIDHPTYYDDGTEWSGYVLIGPVNIK